MDTWFLMLDTTKAEWNEDLTEEGEVDLSVMMSGQTKNDWQWRGYDRKKNSEERERKPTALIP